MPSESGNRSGGGGGRAQQSMGFPPPPQTDPLPCPRCDSLNTKFCYYNNYNLSQPRHFCKSCRRYWTHGGTLRDVPVGGGSRKNSRRSRYHSSSTTTSSSSSSTTNSILPQAEPGPTNHNNLNDGTATATGTFTSLLTSQGSGFLALGGYGSACPGPAPFDEMAFPLGRGSSLWGTTATTAATAYPEVVGDLLGNYAAGGPPETSSSAYNTWQIDGADSGRGVIDGDFLGWPDLAISMQGKSLK